MSSFITPSFPQTHQGVERMGSAIGSLQDAGHRVNGARGLAAVLVAGAASALIVVADQVVSTWADGQLLLAWVALWALIFGAFALFSDAVRGLPDTLTARIDGWKQRNALRTQDAAIWAAANADPRLMAELQTAFHRAEMQAEAAGQPSPQWPFGAPEAQSDKNGHLRQFRY